MKKCNAGKDVIERFLRHFFVEDTAFLLLFY